MHILPRTSPSASLRLTPKRRGNSHSTEAWQLPPQTDKQEPHGKNLPDKLEDRTGAYVGAFRPPGGSEAELGFHVCVAVFPQGGSGEVGGVLAEEFQRAGRDDGFSVNMRGGDEMGERLGNDARVVKHKVRCAERSGNMASTRPISFMYVVSSFLCTWERSCKSHIQ